MPPRTPVLRAGGGLLLAPLPPSGATSIATAACPGRTGGTGGDWEGGSGAGLHGESAGSCWGV